MASTISEFTHLKIPLEDIVKATNNFANENIIGKGGFGNVYKGKLKRGSKSWIEISARRLDRRHGQGNIEFWTEISVLSNLNHPHIVSMIGYCDEKGEKIIVNHHYAKGSLMRYLSDPNLTWMKRVEISIGICHAINYIHYETGSERSYYVIHRNINSFTVLLDENWKPKLSGFEFSVKHPVDRMNQVFFSEPMGIHGYMDPAIEKNGGVTHKSDIYSFGVVLFEILCGRKANEDNKLLAPLAKSYYEYGKLQHIIHPDLWNQMDQNSRGWFAYAAYSCLQNEHTQRIDTKKLIDILCDAHTKQFVYEMPRQHITTTHSHYGPYAAAVTSADDFHETDQLVVHVKHEMGDMVEKDSRIPSKVKSLDHLRIGLKDIILAINNFREFSSTSVSHGINVTRLACFDREYPYSIEGKNTNDIPKRNYHVKIKTIYAKEYRFYEEIEVLTRCKHRNIESLLGFCDEGDYMILVYEFVSTTLEKSLQEPGLTWQKRLKICLDIAHGLNYLHYEMEDEKRVIHGNINYYDILLDNNWEAKIGNFAESVFLPPNHVDDAIHVDKIDNKGSRSDPEYVQTGKLKRESDVYSFGVLMFEILCGILAPSLANMGTRGRPYNSLGQLLRELIYYGLIQKKISPILKGENGGNNSFLPKGPNKDSLDTFINIGYHCLAEKQNDRPTMKVVIKELERALWFQENHKDNFRMSFEDIKVATKNFGHDIGGGGFGRVYKGEVNVGHSNERYPIVAKLLDTSHGQGEQQYYNELQILYEYKHENVIGLVGYSNETEEKIIVYEHASKGSLERYLHDASLTWRNRLKICIDFASGLDFLHGGVNGHEVVIHRDIKAANILLFDDWKAKVGDFGLSVISTINKETDYVIDHACGTQGYLDPLYLKLGFLTIESDIYSFGVVLFEILCGRSTYAIYNQKGQYLPGFIKHMFEDGKQEEVVFQAIKKEIVPKSLTTFLNIAYPCLHEDRGKRPTAKEVLARLKKSLEFQENHIETFRMSLEEVKVATQNFSHDIGGRCFGRLYKGEVALGDSNEHYPIVVKRLDTSHPQAEHQYFNELQILYEYQHEKVIGLVGYNNEKDEKIIVYEHASKGSLEKYLHDPSLTWINRLQICIDCATGLDFLHGGVHGQEVVIHRDIKAANILLFDDWKTKIGDFGLSKISTMDKEINLPCGTEGYLDPLYLKSGFLTTESDIYSFGVVLFEILCGRTTYAIYNHEGQYLPTFIKQMSRQGRQDEVTFQAIKKEIVPKSLTTFRNIAYQCLREDRGKRPTAKEVLVQLKKSLKFQVEGKA